MIKPSLAKGTRDFGPTESARRNYLFSVLKKHFSLYGFQPLETPAMENLSTLTGKYGDEGDQLMFHILNSGNFMEALKGKEELPSSQAVPLLAEKALRYDLTVPFARYVSMNRSQLSFPFRRYQIQPVWRADRPQKGRYREFYQCDIDVIGSTSMVNEEEIIRMIHRVFSELRIPVVIRINNRKLLEALAQWAGCSERFIELTVWIDKLDKVSWETIRTEMHNKQFTPAQTEKLEKALHTASFEELTNLLDIQNAEWLQEMQDLLRIPVSEGHTLKADITLARGLTYYTGTIIEVACAMGNFTSSIGGGGRYDNLTAMFGFPGMSGFGFSFGADRIYDVMTENHLFPDSLETPCVFFLHTGKNEQAACVQMAETLREKQVPCVVYPDQSKLRKQFDYANHHHAHWVVVVGEEELKQQSFALKNMQSGEQELLSAEALTKKIATHYHV
jgi:histidyl-tRNA synthetase